MAQKQIIQEDRDKAVEEAIQFIQTTIKPNDIGWEEKAKTETICQLHDKTYFPRFLGPDKQVEQKIDYMTCYDTLAVNVPLNPNKNGFVTVYFAPETELIGLEKPTRPGEKTMNFKLIGYDPLRPTDIHRVNAPPGVIY